MALLREIRHGWRLIWRTPAQSVSALAVLALGIGLTTALFSVVYAVLFKPLPYAHPEELVLVARTDQSGTAPDWMTGPDVLAVQALAAESALFQAVAPVEINSPQAYAWLAGEGDGEPGQMERLRAAFVTPAFFLGAGRVPLREAVRRRVAEIPGVSEVSTSSTLPFRGPNIRTGGVRTGTRVSVPYRQVTPGFFRAFGIRLLAGRSFSEQDTRDAPPVVILSAALARQLYGDEPAVGQLFHWGDNPPFDVVGVVADVRWQRPDAPSQPAFYVAAAQKEREMIAVIARTPLDLPSFAVAARAAVHAVDPRQAVNVVTTVDQVIADAVAEPRFYALATVGFGVLALVLGAVGIFGAVAAGVSERVHEIGVRVALGASPRAVQRLVLAQALGPVALGVGLGGVAAFWVVRSLRSLLFEVSPADPLTLVAVPLVVLGAAGVAAWLPARGALRINPVDALRQE